MRRNFARWALTFLGFALSLGGAAAMLRGWDIVQVERGWSLFIGGAAALSGGAVVIALAEVVARLDRLLAAGPAARAQAPATEASVEREPAPQIERRAATASRAAPPPPPEPRPAAEHVEQSVAPEPPIEARPAPAPTAPLAPPAPLRVRREEAPATEPPARPRPQDAPPLVEAGEPREIERYQSGGLTYVMYSDGSVELRSDTGAQRFSSIEELRAVLATQE
ncbi:MAG TPA: hypothetical protein VMJ31_11905 [Methylocystis sp.]|nr:hypothetical protein [Methylocystis sp.]